MKKMIAGIGIGLLIGITGTGIASQYIVEDAKFPILVNGKEFKTDKHIVTIDGSTYMPLRAIGEALGVKVNWNEDKNRVEIGETTGRVSVKVVRVVDGDTFEIEGGQKVRLVGVDTPESVHPDAAKNTEFGKTASNYTKSTLEGKTVYLEKDVSETDKYGRLLRFVYLEDGTFFNELLVKEGYAKVYTYPPDVKYADVFVAAEKYARENNKGLWALTDTTITPTPTPITTQTSTTGKIKGNISASGEKIYHVPGGAYYDKTDAEEYFDTEEQAQAAGYRKSAR